MKELIITPEVAVEAENRNKPAMIIISKMNVSFNMAATNRLALKEGTMFHILLKDNKIFYKDVVSGGFKIKTVDHHGAKLINKGIFIALLEHYRESQKSFRFRIGDFNEGMRELTEEV